MFATVGLVAMVWLGWHVDRMLLIEDAADPVQRLSRGLKLLTEQSETERAKTIDSGPVGAIKFERPLRAFDRRLAGQLGALWTALRRESQTGSISTAQLRSVQIRAEETARILGAAAASSRRQAGFAQVTASIAFLGCLFFSLRRRTIGAKAADSQQPEASEVKPAGDWLEEVGRRRIEAIFDGLPVACCSFERDGRVTTWNRAAEDLTGKSAADVCQRPVWEAVEWRRIPEVSKDSLQRLFSGQPVTDIEWNYQHPNGERRIFVAKLLGIQGRSGFVAGGVAALHDVTTAREHERLLRDADATKSAILSSIPDTMLRLDPFGRLVDASDNAHLATGDLAAFLGGVSWPTALPSGLGQKIMQQMRICRAHHVPQNFEFHQGEGKDAHHIAIRVVPSGLAHTLVILHDITHRFQAEEAIRNSETRLRFLIQGSADAILVVNEKGKVTFMSPSAEHVFGRPEAALAKADIVKFAMPEEQDGLKKALATVRQTPNLEDRTIVRFLDDRGQPRDLDILIRNLIDCAFVGGIVLTARDVTAWRNMERELESQVAEVQRINEALEGHRKTLEENNTVLERLATTDGLTNLANHRSFSERLLAEHESAVRHGTPLSVVLLDVDFFKQFNDQFGHQAGDTVLRTIGKILSENMRDNDFAARYGGEEFVVILPRSDVWAASLVAERLRTAIESHPWEHRAVTASFGIATLDDEGVLPGDLVRAADEALYHSKAAGRNRLTHAKELQSAA